MEKQNTLHLYQKSGTAELPPFRHNDNIDNPALYIPSQGLVDAVNVALALGQPLLLTGEPGTGKTQLAYHLAHFFQLDEPLVFNAQTTSTATDLFYHYDALGHFQYNQNNETPLSLEELENQYIQFNALGQAIKDGKRVVVLIDEIDKAPRDLPNDILFAIEKLKFRVPELKNKEYKIDKENRPVIILTSNSEKNLPDAFMRRVAFYHIQFPNKSELQEILTQKMGVKNDHVINHFFDIRDLKLKKKPATAEFLAWAMFLISIDFPLDQLGKPLDGLEKRNLFSSYSILAKNQDDLESIQSLMPK
jgi:MoxR-like ATPase